MVRFTLLKLGCDQDLATLGRYLGGGVAGMGETCGAITGAALSLDIRDHHLPGGAPNLEQATSEDLQRLVHSFTDEFGSRGCPELTGFDMSGPEGFEAFQQSDAPERCGRYISWMRDQKLPLLVDPTATSRGKDQPTSTPRNAGGRLVAEAASKALMMRCDPEGAVGRRQSGNQRLKASATSGPMAAAHTRQTVYWDHLLSTLG